MSKSSMRGIFLSLTIICSLIFLVNPIYVQGQLTTNSDTSVEGVVLDTNSSTSVQENVKDTNPPDNQQPVIISTKENKVVSASSFSLEETTIIEFVNNGDKDINSFRIWLSPDIIFKSFKSERGWSGEKTPQGVIIFSSKDEPVKSGESIKIGVKTDKLNPGINWKAVDKSGNEIEIGISIPTTVDSSQKQIKSVNGILDGSDFRIIPEKPSAGSTIRVIGTNFGVSQEFNFFIDSKKIDVFETDGNGYFITTVKIPETQASDRVELIIKDQLGNEKKISLRIGELDNRIPISDDVKLSIQGIPKVMHPGDVLEIYGTAKPNSVVSGSVMNPEDEVTLTRTAPVDAKGNWKLSESILVPLDAQFGRHKVEITDGRETITQNWIIETAKKILINPIKIKFEPGEVMRYNGTAIPNIPIELVLEDELGSERFSDIMDVDSTGSVKFEYPTTANVDKPGTWKLFATQGKEKEIILAGLGVIPSPPVLLEFDKLNYKSKDTAILSLIGAPTETVNLLIIDPSDKQKGEAISITLEADGTATYPLELTGFASGVYTAEVKKGNTESTKFFTVGLQTGSGAVKINTTKLEYRPGDQVLILGDTNPNVVLTLTFTDPSGKLIKEIETFSDKNGKISVDKFRIPSIAKLGIWEIQAKSGSNFAKAEVNVIFSKEEGMKVTTTEREVIPGVTGNGIEIKAINAVGTVEIEISGPEGKVVQKLKLVASSSREVITPWDIPEDALPGTYTIKVKDGYNSATTTFIVK